MRQDRWASLGRKLWQRLIEVGPAYAMADTFSRVVPPNVFRLNCICVCKLNLSSERHDYNGELEIRLACREDINLLSSFRPAAVVWERLDRGDRAYIISRGNELLANVWLRAGHFDEAMDGIRFILPPEKLWLYDARVAHRYRRRGLYTELLKFATADLAKAGVSSVVFGIDALNRASIKAHVMAGSRVVGRILIIRLLGQVLGLRVSAGTPRRKIRHGTSTSPVEFSV